MSEETPVETNETALLGERLRGGSLVAQFGAIAGLVGLAEEHAALTEFLEEYGVAPSITNTYCVIKSTERDMMSLALNLVSFFSSRLAPEAESLMTRLLEINEGAHEALTEAQQEKLAAALQDYGHKMFAETYGISVNGLDVDVQLEPESATEED